MRTLLLFALVGCEHPDQRHPAPTPGPPDVGARSTSTDAGAVERYFRHEWRFMSGDGKVQFEARAGNCRSMPAKPPEGTTITLTRLDGETMELEYFGVTASYPCRFSWGMPWSHPPRGACTQLSAVAFEALWRELVALELVSIRTRTVSATSPHRGGWSIGVRYIGSECEVADRGESHVVDDHLERFDRARVAVARAFDGSAP